MNVALYPGPVGDSIVWTDLTSNAREQLGTLEGLSGVLVRGVRLLELLHALTDPAKHGVDARPMFWSDHRTHLL